MVEHVLSMPKVLNSILNTKREKITGVVAYTSNPSIQEAEAGGSRVPGQAGLQSEYLKTKPRLH